MLQKISFPLPLPRFWISCRMRYVELSHACGFHFQFKEQAEQFQQVFTTCQEELRLVAKAQDSQPTTTEQSTPGAAAENEAEDNTSHEAAEEANGRPEIPLCTSVTHENVVIASTIELKF